VRGRGGERWERGAGGRNDPNNVCTCEINNNFKKHSISTNKEHLWLLA
jgi:hypothetical protein